MPTNSISWYVEAFEYASIHMEQYFVTHNSTVSSVTDHWNQNEHDRDERTWNSLTMSKNGLYLVPNINHIFTTNQNENMRYRRLVSDARREPTAVTATKAYKTWGTTFQHINTKSLALGEYGFKFKFLLCALFQCMIGFFSFFICTLYTHYCSLYTSTWTYIHFWSWNFLFWLCAFNHWLYIKVIVAKVLDCHTHTHTQPT